MKQVFNHLQNSITIFFISITLVVLLGSCHKVVSPSNQIGNSHIVNFSQAFEDYWSSMNKTYVFWSEDKTDWDKVHSNYAPAFKRLDDEVAITNMNELYYKAYKLYNEIAAGLIDSHYSLSISNPYSFFPYSVNPALERKWNNDVFIGNLFLDSSGFITKLYPDGYHYYNFGVDSTYLDKMVWGYDSTSRVAPFDAMSGIIKNTHILYFSFSQFSLQYEYENGPNPAVKAAIDNFFMQLNDPSVTSLIIDVRGNGGGSIYDLNFLMGRLVSKPMKIGYTRSKSGTGRLDYTPWADAFLKPWYGFPAGFNKPIAVLADGLSVSMAELTAMTVKNLPNTIFVGDTTWGANGPLTENAAFNAGSFSFGNEFTDIQTGSTYYFGNAYTSSCMFKYIDNKIYEGKGFPPDYVIKVRPNQIFLPGDVVNDPQLNKAISLLPK